MKLISPNGTEIIGTLEKVYGWAGIINDSLKREEDGTFDFDYDGETRIYWEGQRTVEREGERVFVDDLGDEFLESQLKLVEDE